MRQGASRTQNSQFVDDRASSRTYIVPFTIGATVIALLLFAYYTYTWQNYFNFQFALDTCTKPFCDFVTFYYPMGEAIFHTGLPVKGV
jgi:hypothetical protein